MWSRIKEFFSKIWWVVLVPVGIFILHFLFKKETPELDKLIKEKKKDIKENKKAIKGASLTAAENQEALEDSIESGKETSIKIDTRAQERDNQAGEFFK